MFSSRLHWDLEPNPITRRLAARRRAGARILDLTESNPTSAGLDYPRDAILAALASPEALRYEPAPAGLGHARQAVSAYYAARGLAVPPERILLTASTSEAYAFLFKLLTEPGDEILAPRPSYPLFEFLAGMELVRTVAYPLHYQENWWMDIKAIEAAITPRTRAVVVVHPNNPTGSFVKRDEAARLAALASARHLAIISDEVFLDYAFAPDAARLASFTQTDSTLTFSLSGLSKIAGLPQMKLGWIVAGGPPALAAQALERLELIADTYLSVSAPIQHAAAGLLASGASVRRQIQARVQANHALLGEAVARVPAVRLLTVEGGWYGIVQVPRIRSEEEWTLGLLEEEDVLVQPGFFYDFEGEAFLVVSLLTPGEVFAEGLRRLTGYVAAAL